jgi:hypothetical protein
MGLLFRYAPGELWRDTLYIGIMMTAFAWMVVPPVPEGPVFFRIAGIYRLLAGSLLGALSLLPIVAGMRKGSGLYEFIWAQAEAAAALYSAAGGADVVQRSLSERYITPEAILEAVRFIFLRGGGVASCIFLFVISRQIALLAAWFVRRVRAGGNITGFHVPPPFIWVLSVSLPVILAGRWTNMAFLEIPAWNVLVVCAILYLAQGGGIVLHFLSRIRHPGARFCTRLFLIMALCSPGINAIALGALALLGVAENWVPFRALNTNGPSSTPGM